MGTKDRKKKRTRGSSGGKLSGLRTGFKGILGAGGGSKKKESLASRILTYVLLAVAIGLLVYRFTR